MLDQSLTYKLASISDDAIGGAESLFRNRFGMDVRTLRVLRLIDDRPGTTFTELAARTRFERSATSRILAQLIREGLVRRKIDPEDARHFRLHATTKGKALRARADPLTVELETLLLEPLRADERLRFLEMLDKLNAWAADGYALAMQSKFPDAQKQPREKSRRKS